MLERLRLLRQRRYFRARGFVNPGDHIDCEDNIISIETGKVALDIPTPWAGTVRSVHIEVGDKPDEGALLITLDRDR